jgi:hypothetical protein
MMRKCLASESGWEKHEKPLIIASNFFGNAGFRRFYPFYTLIMLGELDEFPR